MRHPLITISLGALVVASVLHASAPAGWCSEPVVVNEGWEDAWAIQGDYGIDWAHAQGFETPSGDAITCDRVSLYLERTGTLTGNIEYAIATDSWGEPDTILWDTERSASSLPTSAGWYTITVSPPLTLSANTPYFIIMDWHAGGMGGSGYLEVYVNNDYPDGEHLTFVDNGASGYWAHKSDDMLFRVYGQIPDINCEDLSGYDYGTVLVDSCSSTRTWTVTNEGDATLTGYISLSGSNPSEFEITQGGGSFSLGAGASRTVRIRFCPTSPGTKYATLHITSNDPDEDPCYKTLVGNGLDPVPSICRSPSSLSPTCCQGQNASSQSFEVWNCGSGTLNYSISDNASWLSCSPSSGSSTGEYDTISVNYSTSGLSCGAYSATITITDPDADNSPKTIGVNLTVDCPSICRSPTSLAPECTEGQNAPSDNFSVWNCGCGTLSYSISDNGSWLSCSPGSGSSTGEHDTISVNYSTAGLTCGSYSATITINGNADNSPQTIAVNLTVQCQPSICYSPSSLTNDCNEGEDALDQYFDVWNCGSGTLSYSISDNASWLSCSPTSGTSTGEHDTITVNYTTASLSPGNYSATITITGNAGISPQTIPVSLMVIPSDAQWTILVYLAADNNLETFGIDDFLEMADVGSTDDVRIVVQFDRIAGHDDRYGDWTDTRRFLIEQGDTPASTPLEILGELDMGNPQTLIDFVVWGMAGFPADHYLLVLWDHGDGWRMRDGGMVKPYARMKLGARTG